MEQVTKYHDGGIVTTVEYDTPRVEWRVTRQVCAFLWLSRWKVTVAKYTPLTTSEFGVVSGWSWSQERAGEKAQKARDELVAAHGLLLGGG